MHKRDKDTYNFIKNHLANRNAGCILRSTKGASVVFAIVGFMFAAMISIVVVSLAYSNALKNRKQQFEQQSFILAQNMAAIITDALAGNDDTSSPFASDDDSTSTSGLTVGIQRIDESVKNATGGYDKIVLYNPAGVTDSGSVTFETDKTNLKYSIIDEKSGVLANGTNLRTVIKGMATKVLRGETPSSQVLSTSLNDGTTTSEVEATLNMDSAYTLTAKIVAETKKGSVTGLYCLELTAYATVGSTPGQCSGTIEDLGSGKYKATVQLDTISSDITKKTMKVITDNVKWQTNQIKIEYISD